VASLTRGSTSALCRALSRRYLMATPNFLCRSVAHSIQENVVPGCVHRVPGRAHVSRLTNLGAPSCAAARFGAGDVSHGTYVREVAAGRIPARPAYGVVHAVRVTLFAPGVDSAVRRVGRPLLSDPFGVAMAAAFHDVARQDEGEDLWDDESAQVFVSWMTSLGVPPLRIEVLRHAVASKDPGSEGLWQFPLTGKWDINSGLGG
jgi:hypothetical protein